jgi:uncharacterized protein YdhG (YjbR/CyaY superfamily)
MDAVRYKTVKEYFAALPPGTEQLMAEMRKTIKALAPEATEVISYNMPAFKMKRVLVYYAAYKKHIGFYPSGSGIKAFEHELDKYKWSKGAIQFRLDEPLPVKLITKIVNHRLKEESL